MNTERLVVLSPQARRWAALVTSACAILGLVPGCGKAEPRPKSASSPARAVRLVAVEYRPMEVSIPATGTLAAQERSTLSAKVPGRLQRLNVDLGSQVNEGDVIAQVEPRDYELRTMQATAAVIQAQADLGLPPDADATKVPLDQISSVRQAKAVLDEAARNRDRVRSLAASGVASQSEVDTAEASYTVALTRHDAAREQAQMRLATLTQRLAELEIAKKQLSDATVRAPFTGSVQSRPAAVGEYVAAGVPIVTLVKVDPLRLKLEVSERESGAVRLGQTVELVAEGVTNVHRGRVARLSPAVDQESRMLLVEADVPNPGSLRPGLFARGRIIVNEADRGLSVPRQALMTFAGLEKVVTVREGKAVECPVVTGRRGTNWVEIVSGLTEGDRVVLEPAGLRTGRPVVVEGPVESSREGAGTQAHHAAG